MSILRTNQITNTAGDASPNIPGAVLQVVSHRNSGVNSTASSTFVTTDSIVTITPTSTNSKILIQTNAPLYGNNNNTHTYTTIYRDGTNLNGTSELQLFATGSDAMGRWTNGSMQFLDSPNTTSEVTYTVYFRNSTSGTSHYDGSGVGSIITAMEIGG